MNIENISQTNQKLMIVKLHLRQLQKLAKDESVSSHSVLVKAYKQAVSFHFALAYHSFLQEMAKDFNLHVAKDDSFAHLQQLLDKQEIVCLQCDLLAALESDSASWLVFMLNSYEQCWLLESDAKFSQVSQNLKTESVIEIKDITGASDDTQFQQSYTQLQEVVNQYRELMQEW